MMKIVFLLLMILAVLPLAGETPSDSTLAEQTGLDREHFLIQGFSRLDRSPYLPQAYDGEGYLYGDIPLGKDLLAPSPATLIKLFTAGGLREEHRVLIAGRGCSYPAAALAQAGLDVYLIDPESKPSSSYNYKSEENLKGWISQAPFDFIALLNSPRESVPKDLIRQLSSEGTVISVLTTPKGNRGWIKVMMKGEDLEISLMDTTYVMPLF